MPPVPIVASPRTPEPDPFCVIQNAPPELVVLRRVALVPA
jgi:hypothetical protein